MLLLLFAPQPTAPAAEFINFASVVNELLPPLNAYSLNDLVFWSEADLYQWLDEAAQRLSRLAGVFVERDTTLTTSTGVGEYSLPADQISTIQVDVNGFVLRARTVQELEALDETWPSTIDKPVSFIQDRKGLTKIQIYPAPSAPFSSLPIGLIIHAVPSTIDQNNALLAMPTCLQEYFTFHALGEARAKETRASMPETATWFRQQEELMMNAIREYWGTAQ